MKKLPRWLRILLYTATGIISLIILLWAGLAWYITSHKKELLQQVSEKLHKQTGGTLIIKELTPSLWKSFPDISIALEGVALQDSLYEQHHHNLLEAKILYVKVNTFDLLASRIEISRVTAAHGSIFLYTDSTGYSNTSFLKSRNNDTSAKGKSPVISAFRLEDMDIMFVHKVKQKLFHIHIRDLDGTTTFVKQVMQLHVKTDAHVHQFCFNTVRGSYIKDKDLEIDAGIVFDPKQQTLFIADQEIKIGGEPVMFTGLFEFAPNPAKFSIGIKSLSIPYKTAVSWMSQNIAKKLDSFDFEKPVAVEASISGVMAYRNIPLIRVSYIIKDNTLHTKAGDVDEVNFNGYYFNEAVGGKGHGDDNSKLQFQSVRGLWNNIPFTVDTLSITNLLLPFLDAHIRSAFPITALNNVTGGNTFSFDKGTATADFRYIGGVLAKDTTPYSINGFIQISNAGMTYIPRALSFDHVKATVMFKEDNLFLRDVHLNTKSSDVSIEGEALHFLRLYFTDPRKIAINMRVKSPQLNLNDFLGFVEKRKPDRVKPQAAGNRIGGQLDNVLTSSSIILDAAVDKLIYKNFTGSKITARATLSEEGINIEKAGLHHAGGTMNITGVIDQKTVNNPFSLKADIHKADVAALFKSFDEFGQQAISGNNLQGKLTAIATVSGKMTESARIIKNSINGNVDFRLEDGVLNNFSPLEKVGKFIFKNRNLSHVTFKDIHNKLQIAGNKIIIPKMKIESSAVNMEVQGVYGMPRGTDIFMSIPLRNPEKEEPNTIIGKLLRNGRGIVVNLRAQDGDEHGVKIGWDPFKKGKKALKDEEKPADNKTGSH